MHAAYEPVSSLQRNVSEPDGVVSSLPLNPKLAAVSVVPEAGLEVIVAVGAVVSAGAEIVHVAVAGEASTLPAASVARTLKVCEPTARPL